MIVIAIVALWVGVLAAVASWVSDLVQNAKGGRP